MDLNLEKERARSIRIMGKTRQAGGRGDENAKDKSRDINTGENC